MNGKITVICILTSNLIVLPCLLPIATINIDDGTMSAIGLAAFQTLMRGKVN